MTGKMIRQAKNMIRRQKSVLGKLVFPMLIAIILCSGCGKKFDIDASYSGQTEDDQLIVVGVSQVGSESVWRTANTASIRKVFTKENGYLLIFDNARQKQENQIKAIRGFISQRVDYIVFSPIEEDGWDDVLKEAKEAGIPVILMDRMIKTEDESLYSAWVGSDFYKEGVNAGNWLAEHLSQTGQEEEEINIVVLKGTEGASSTIGRTRGFDAVAQQQENWNILAEADGDFTTAKAREEMGKLMQQYEKIDVVVSQNDDMTFGVIEAVQNAGKTTGENGDVTVISFDAVRSALEKVEEGTINVDIECNPEQGEYIENVIRQLEAGETPEKYSYVPEQVFTGETVDQEMIDNRSY